MRGEGQNGGKEEKRYVTPSTILFSMKFFLAVVVIQLTKVTSLQTSL